MNINGILSIIVALAMMLSGGYNADQPEALSARTLTLSDITIVMGEDTIQLTPAISMGAMTEDGKAVLDIHMDYGDGQLFPVQLAVDQEKATLSLVKGGKSFSISNETIMKLLKDMGIDLGELKDFDPEKALEKLYQDLLKDMDEEGKAILEQMVTDLLPKGVDMFKYLEDPANQAQLEADMAGVAQEIRTMNGESAPDTIQYNDKEYSVTTYEYSLENEGIMAMVDKVYTANEKTRAFYESYFNLINMIIGQQNKEIEIASLQMQEGYTREEAAAAAEAPAASETNGFAGLDSGLSVLRPVGAPAAAVSEAPAASAVPTPSPMPTIAPVESFADIYAMAGLEMRMDCVETISDDGEYSAADITMYLSAPEMDMPIIYEISALQVGEEMTMEMTTSFEQDGEYMDMDIIVETLKGESRFAMGVEYGELEEDSELDETTGEEETVVTREIFMDMSVSIESAWNPDTGMTEYSGGIVVENEDVQAVLSAGGEADAAGNSATNVIAGYVEDDVESYISFILETSAEPFESVAPAMDDTEITPELIDILTGKTPLGDELTVYEDKASSVGIIGGADGPTSVFVTEPTPEPTLSPEQQAMNDFQAALEAAAAPFADDAAALMKDDGVSDLVSLFIFGYIPEDDDEDYVDYEDYDEDYEDYDEDYEADIEDEYEDADGEETYELPEAPELNPEFAYIPEGYQLEETETDAEYGTYSYSFSNPDTYDAIYVSLYSSAYGSDRKIYVNAEDGSLQPVEGRVVQVEDEGDGSIYAEIEEGAVSIGISVYDETFDLDELGKFIAGITY